jgi:hypothetical protein
MFNNRLLPTEWFTEGPGASQARAGGATGGWGALRGVERLLRRIREPVLARQVTVWGSEEVDWGREAVGLPMATPEVLAWAEERG